MVTRDGLVAEYLFNGDADDTSGHGADGVVHGAIPTMDRFGNPESAYWFDGRDDYIIVSPPPRLSADAITVSVWARYDSSIFDGWSNCIICQDNGDDEERSRRIFQISALGNQIVWHRMVEARDPRSRERIRPNLWYHIAGVFEHGVHRFYMDGMLTDASVDRLKTHAEEPLYIGRKGTPEPYFFFNGAIDDIRVYNRALDSDEVKSLFEEDGFRKEARPTLKNLTTMLPVQDLVVSLKFYQKALGFTLIRHDEKWQWAYLSADGRGLMLAQSIYRGRPSDAVLYITPENLDAFHQSLLNSGYEVPDIAIAPDGLREVRLTDPDGNRIWVGQK